MDSTRLEEIRNRADEAVRTVEAGYPQLTNRWRCYARDVPFLLAEVDRLQTALAALKDTRTDDDYAMSLWEAEHGEGRLRGEEEG